MIVESILKTELVKSNPKNTGILSKTNDRNPKNIKRALNPIFTILNKDFNKQLRQDYEKQSRTRKQIINREYLETKQKDILRLYKEVYPDNYEEKIEEHLGTEEKPRLDFLHIGLDDITRSLPISLDDINKYEERGGYKNYMFSHQARPEIIVFDFDLQVKPEELETIKQDLRKYLYLMEYKESNGHLHIYLYGTEEKKITLADHTEDKHLFEKDNNVMKVDIFKASKRATGCSSPNNDYEIIYNEKPSKRIELKQSIILLAKSLGYTVNNKLLEELLNKAEEEEGAGEEAPRTVPQDTTNNTSNSNTSNNDRKTRPATEENIEAIIEHATPLFQEKVKDKGTREVFYRAFTGWLLSRQYEEKTIEKIIKEIYKEIKGDDPLQSRLSSMKSCFRGYKKGANLYGKTKFKELINPVIENKKGKNKTELNKELAILEKEIDSHNKQIVYKPEQEEDFILLDNGLIMDVEDHLIFTYNSKTGDKYIKMSTAITGVTIYQEEHVNPLIKSNNKLYSLQYTTATGTEGETTPEDIDILTGLLNKETFTRDDKKTKEIIKNIIEYYIIQDKAEYKQITPPEGFYLDVKTNNIAYIGLTEEITTIIEKDLTSEEIKEVLLEYETLSTYYKDLEKYIANTLSGCQLPLTYLNKQVSEEYSIQTPDIRAVSMTGTSGAGKSYNCEFILKFSSIPIENKNIKLYSSINTIYRYGEQCVKSTLPLMIDEADGIANPITTYDYELSRDIKASITSMYVREKSNDKGKTLTAYPNYRNIVINSNSQFNPDYGNRRRLTSQVYSITEKITPEDVELKNRGYPDNKERVTLNKFFGIFINLLRNKINEINREENKTTGICNIFTNKDFTKNIILEMYRRANLDTDISNMIYNYNTDLFNADINLVDTEAIIRNTLYNYILGVLSESLKPDTPKDPENIQTTLEDHNTERGLYGINNLRKVLFDNIAKGNIKGVSSATRRMPKSMGELEIALTKDIVSILNENKDIQVTLKDLAPPVGGEYTQIKKLGTKAVRLTLEDLINTVFI